MIPAFIIYTIELIILLIINEKLFKKVKKLKRSLYLLQCDYLTRTNLTIDEIKELIERIDNNE